MQLPSLAVATSGTGQTKPRLLVLEVSRPHRVDQGVRDPRRVDDEPTAYLLVERVEHYERDEQGAILRATIQLYYQVIEAPERLSSPWNSFDGCYERCLFHGERVSLTSTSLTGGALSFDLPKLRGHRIGTYLMNEIVLWAKQWTSANVKPISLLIGQATAENKQRRNQFYEQFGISFDFDDAEKKTGTSRPVASTELREVETWRDNIREIPVIDALRDGIASSRDATVGRRALRSLEEDHKDLKRAFWRIAGIACGLALMLIIALAIWTWIVATT
jgi:GNAT superfamily N-acetyltransferase